LQGQVALVAGGTSGIGRASAFRLAEEGATVAITSRSESSIADEIKKSGGHAMHLRCDASDAEANAATPDEICATFGDITILSANADILSPPAPTCELSVAEFEQRVLPGPVDTGIQRGEAGTHSYPRGGCPTSPRSRHRSVVADTPNRSRESRRSVSVGTPHS
jgi:hypothetical protein